MLSSHLIVILICLVLQGCESGCEDKTLFTYNAASGKCENCEGKAGYNNFDIQKIRKSKNAECLAFQAQDLVYLLDTSAIENFNKSGYNNLEGYNFKGSSFDGARIFFNNISGADLSGADLRNLQYGYAVIKGKTDKYTRLPLSGKCDATSDSVICHL